MTQFTRRWQRLRWGERAKAKTVNGEREEDVACLHICPRCSLLLGKTMTFAVVHASEIWLAPSKGWRGLHMRFSWYVDQWRLWKPERQNMQHTTCFCVCRAVGPALRNTENHQSEASAIKLLRTRPQRSEKNSSDGALWDLYRGGYGGIQPLKLSATPVVQNVLRAVRRNPRKLLITCSLQQILEHLYIIDI